MKQDLSAFECNERLAIYCARKHKPSAKTIIARGLKLLQEDALPGVDYKIRLVLELACRELVNQVCGLLKQVARAVGVNRHRYYYVIGEIGGSERLETGSHLVGHLAFLLQLHEPRRSLAQRLCGKESDV